MKICATLERPITPNKQIINCDIYYEGRYLLVIKKTQGFLNLNEIVPNLFGETVTECIHAVCAIRTGL